MPSQAQRSSYDLPSGGESARTDIKFVLRMHKLDDTTLLPIRVGCTIVLLFVHKMQIFSDAWAYPYSDRRATTQIWRDPLGPSGRARAHSSTATGMLPNRRRTQPQSRTALNHDSN